jgi:hypothetical protein
MGDRAVYYAERRDFVIYRSRGLAIAFCVAATLMLPATAFGQGFAPPRPPIAPREAQQALLSFPSNLLGILRYLNRAGLNFSNVLISQVVVGNSVQQIVTVGVDQRNDVTVRPSPYGMVMFIPSKDLAKTRSLNIGINFSVVDITQVAIGDDIQQVAVVTVDQQNPASGSVLMVPAGQYNTLAAMNMQFNVNLSLVKLQQLAVGNNISQTAIVDVKQGNVSGSKFYVPVEWLRELRALNANLNISIVNIEQIAIGNRITQVAVVDVHQA